MRTIEITTIRTYTKEVTIKIDYPDGVELHDIEEHLCSNPIYQETIDERLQKEDYMWDDETTRYDVYETVTVDEKIYGGTL